MVINPTWETMASNVISQPTNAITKLSTIVKTHKYRGLRKGHHFILMAMEVHDTPKHDIYYFIKEYVCLFHDRWLQSYLSMFFCIQFFKQCVSIVLQRVSTFVIERNIALVGDVYSRPPIIIRSHDLHASNTRRVVGEIIPCHEKD